MVHLSQTPNNNMSC